MNAAQMAVGLRADVTVYDISNARLAGEGAPVIGIRGDGKGFSAGVDLSEYGSGGTPSEEDRKSTRLNSITNAHLVCRLLIEKKNKNTTPDIVNHKTDLT